MSFPRLCRRLCFCRQAGDFLFRQMMELTLREDKEIIENIYPEYQRGFMNARYDKQVSTRNTGGEFYGNMWKRR